MNPSYAEEVSFRAKLPPIPYCHRNPERIQISEFERVHMFQFFIFGWLASHDKKKCFSAIVITITLLASFRSSTITVMSKYLLW